MTSRPRYGIAFDDGALNRVVEPGRDDEELQKLDLFLSGSNRSVESLPKQNVNRRLPDTLAPADHNSHPDTKRVRTEYSL